VRGARAVELSNLTLEEFTTGVDWRGVDVSEGADVTIVNLVSPEHDWDLPGSSGVSFGIRSVGSRVTVRGGHLGLATEAGEAFAVWLEDSDDSTIEATSMSLLATDSAPEHAILTGVRVLASGSVRLSGVAMEFDDAQNYDTSGPYIGLDASSAGTLVAETMTVDADGDGDVTAVRAVDTSLAWTGSVALLARGYAKGLVLENASASNVRGVLDVRGRLGATAIQVGGVTPDFVLTGSDVRAEATGNTGDSFGVLLDGCGGIPLISENTRILAAGTSARSEAIRAVGDCHPLIEKNALIRGESTFVAESAAVHCTGANGIGSRCRIVDNTELASEASHGRVGGDAYARTVFCDAGGCSEIVGNTILGGTNDRAICDNACYFEGAGIDLASSQVLVKDNSITGGGCGDLQTGITLRGNSNRIQGNTVTGRDCSFKHPLVYVYNGYGLYVPQHYLIVVSDNVVEDNTLAGNARPQTCAAVFGKRGVSFRRNVLASGGCADSVVFLGGFDVLQDNQFLPSPYLYRASLNILDPRLTTIQEVNALPGASGNY
jgi:hypothetical protein